MRAVRGVMRIDYSVPLQNRQDILNLIMFVRVSGIAHLQKISCSTCSILCYVLYVLHKSTQSQLLSIIRRAQHKIKPNVCEKIVYKT